MSFAERSAAKPAALAEELVALMRDAVRLRMVADVPLGAFLSGRRIFAVVAMMAEQNAQAVKTCTIGFDVGSLDERQYADHVARRFATDHRTRIVSPDV